MTKNSTAKETVSRRGFLTGVTVGSVGAVVGREAIAQEFIETNLTLDDLAGEWWLTDNDDPVTPTDPNPPVDPQPPLVDPEPPFQETLAIRRDIYTLPEGGQAIQSIRRGIAEMRRRSAVDPSDPTGWNFQAAIHAGQTGRGLQPCQHANRYFLSWHRMYLYYFERILRQASGDQNLTLPYWDYSIPGRASLPGAARFPADQVQNPLYWANRNPFFNGGGALPPHITETETTLRSFAYDGSIGFNRALESRPHNGVHVSIGGSMASVAQAALDPVFWLHHCNVDRQWNRWISRGGSRVNPTDIDFLSQQYNFFNETGDLVSIIGEDILTTENLGYRYDDDPADLGSSTSFIVASAEPAPSPNPVFIESLSGDGGPSIAASVAAPPPPGAAPAPPLRRASATLAEAAPTIRLGAGKTKVALRIATPDAPPPPVQPPAPVAVIESLDGSPTPAAVVPAAPAQAFQAAPPVSTAELFTTATNTPEVSSVILQLQEIAFEKSPGVFNIFVNLPEGADPDPRGPYYAGYFAPFAQNQTEEAESYDILSHAQSPDRARAVGWR